MIHVTFLVEDETLLPPQKNSSRTGQYYFTDAGRIFPGYTAFKKQKLSSMYYKCYKIFFFPVQEKTSPVQKQKTS